MNEVKIPNEKANRIFIFGIVIAAALLNVGLYFLLYIFTPFVSGIIIGYLIKKSKEGALASFAGSLVSFLPMLLLIAPAIIDSLVSSGQATLAEIYENLSWFYLQLVVSGLILSAVGFFGGYVGGLLGKRIRIE
ncbi:MAG: hypothetical protein ACFFEF_05190 [Candidatus Thorarchaeota archaeon]